MDVIPTCSVALTVEELRDLAHERLDALLQARFELHECRGDLAIAHEELAEQTRTLEPQANALIEIIKILNGGGMHKIATIKLVRKLTRWDLREAKEMVERHWSK